MSDIFVSYANEDRDVAQYLAQVLGAVGWSVFSDQRIDIGINYRLKIGSELSEARCVIVLWSKASIQSAWVEDEADEGKRRGILLPALIENVEPPLGFRSIETANLMGYGPMQTRQGYGQLLTSLLKLIGPPHIPGVDALRQNNFPGQEGFASARAAASEK